MLGAIACTAGILRLWSSPPVIPWLDNKVLIWACAIVGFWAVTVAVNEGRRIYRRSVARNRLGELYRKGQSLILIFASPDADADRQAHEWIDETRALMREYLDDSYVSRFDVLYSRLAVDRIQHGEIVQRLEKLDGFIHELQVSS